MKKAVIRDGFNSFMTHHHGSGILARRRPVFASLYAIVAAIIVGQHLHDVALRLLDYFCLEAIHSIHTSLLYQI